MPWMTRPLVLMLVLLLCRNVLCDNSPVTQDLWIPSRSVEIPVTLVQPGSDSPPWPLVVMAHGHGGSRDEAGGFANLASLLAGKGIASVRMDFPGCGESREPWPQNTIEHMLADIAAARDFALEHAPVDPGRVGLLGYSMGGRLAMLSAGKGFDYAALVLWAPAASDGAADFYGFFGGAQRYSEWHNVARQQGTVVITTPWGQQQELSLAWFDGLESSKPLQGLADFQGPLLVLHGSMDEVIPPAQSAGIVQALPQSRRILLAGGRHGLGFYDHDPATARQVLSDTVAFFHGALSQR